ncbi:MAG: tetratricopeptide repeat protein [Planctomycetota bacterium]
MPHPAQPRRDPLAVALVVATGLLLAAWCLREDVQPDLYFHLAAGRWIWEHGLPQRNVFLAPHPDHRFVDHEWLFQALAWPAWQLGGARLLALAKGLAVLAGFAALAAATRRRGPRLRWAVLAAATLLAGGRFVLRPEVVSLACAAGFTWALTRLEERGPSRRMLIVLPSVQLLWSNAHGFSLLGPALVLVTLAARLAHAGLRRARGDAPPPEERRALGGLAALAGAVCLASLLNPYGLEAALYPFLVLLRTGQDAASAGLNYQVVELWSPFHPALAGQPEVVLFKLWLLAAAPLWLLALARGRSSPGEGARAALLCASSLLYVRNLPFAAVGLAPITVAGLGALDELARARLAAPVHERGRRALTALAALAALLLARAVAADELHQNASYDPRPGTGLGEFTAYPEAAAALDARPGAKALFNNFGAGHYLIWARGERPPLPWICGNTDLYPGAHLRRYAEAFRGERPLGRLLDEEGVTHVLLDHRVETPDHVIAALLRDPAWALIHADRRALLFERGGTPLDLAALARAAQGWRFPSEEEDRFAPTRLLRALHLLPRRAPNPLHRLQTAQLLGRLGRVEEALALARAAERLAPDSPLVLRVLADLEEAAGRDASERWRSLAAATPEDSLPWIKLGLTALRRGDALSARRGFEAALARDPTSPLAIQDLLAALEVGGDALGIRATLSQARLEPGRRDYYLGVAAGLEEDWAAAATHLEAAVGATPDLGPALSRLAEAQGRLGRWSAAEETWGRLCRATPEDASAWRALGRVRRVRGDDAGALAAWDRAARADPRELEALLLSGALHATRGERAPAQAALAEGRRRAPRDPRLDKLAALITR